MEASYAALKEMVDGVPAISSPPPADPAMAQLFDRARGVVARLAETQEMLGGQTLFEGPAERKRRGEAQATGADFIDTVAEA